MTTTTTTTGPLSSTVSTKTVLEPWLESDDIDAWSVKLSEFLRPHAVHHRPVALVSSGGTAVDLEVHTVRTLENFSTGWRGAVLVEQFLARGYAVIHLGRPGTAAPFARHFQQFLGLPPTGALSEACLDRLCQGPTRTRPARRQEGPGDHHHHHDPTKETERGAGQEEEEEEENDDADDEEERAEELVRQVLAAEKDVWWSGPRRSDPYYYYNYYTSNTSPPVFPSDGLRLHRAWNHSTRLRQVWEARAQARQQGRLLTVPFRTVEEYLRRLHQCTTALQHSHRSLAVLVLAAAVSDFYLPADQKPTHKIQSGEVTSSKQISKSPLPPSPSPGQPPPPDPQPDQEDHPGGESGGDLVLRLKPVPKVLGRLRTTWAPDAFCISFKLETDPNLLRTKAERAVARYGCHAVVGNLLATRHDQVWWLAPADFRRLHPITAQDWTLTPLNRPPQSPDPDALEHALVEKMVEAHFEFISWHFHSQNDNDPHQKKNGPALETARQLQQQWREQRRRAQREHFWHRAQQVGLEVAGALLAMALSYSINSALQRRLRG